MNTEREIQMILKCRIIDLENEKIDIYDKMPQVL